MRSNLGDKVRLQHILDAISELESYVDGIQSDEFSKNSMMKFACIKQMEIIGEASNHISDDLRNSFTNVEWSQIVGMRNIFVHEYFGIDAGLVWQIIKEDIPEFKEKITIIIQSI